MKTQQLQLVSFEQAKRLKELGFNYPVRTVYENGIIINYHNDKNRNDDKSNREISAPTVPLALKYLRNEKELLYVINPEDEDLYGEPLNKIRYTADIPDKEQLCTSTAIDQYDTFEEAEQAILEWAFENLND
jgi:hypothetical protein